MLKSLLFEMIGRPHDTSISSATVNANSDAKKRRKSENGADSDWEFLMGLEGKQEGKIANFGDSMILTFLSR